MIASCRAFKPLAIGQKFETKSTKRNVLYAMQKQQPQHFTLARAQNATQIMLDSTVGCELRKLTLFILNG